MPTEISWITDDMVTFAEQSQGATAALLEQLRGTDAAARLMKHGNHVSALLAQKYGVIVDIDSCISLPGVKAAVLSAAVDLDLDSILFFAEQKIAAVAFAAAGEAPERRDEVDEPPQGFEDWLPTDKMNWARKNGRT